MKLAALFIAIAATFATADERRESTIGMTARVTELVLPGSELQAAPLDEKAPIVLRVVRVSPHGDAFRYDLEYQGLEAGDHDLARFLVRKDGTKAADLPPIPVHVSAVLPADRVRPNPPHAGEVLGLGGYRALWIAGSIAWIAGLALILRAGKKRVASMPAPVARPKTLAERLRPLVLRAVAGELSQVERAELELSLYRYWSRRLGLTECPPSEILPELRKHAEAGPLLVALESWLHAPASSRREVDLGALLAPYRSLAPDALEDGALEDVALATSAHGRGARASKSAGR
jgi:hypothetical protein